MDLIPVRSMRFDQSGTTQRINVCGSSLSKVMAMISAECHPAYSTDCSGRHQRADTIIGTSRQVPLLIRCPMKALRRGRAWIKAYEAQKTGVGDAAPL